MACIQVGLRVYFSPQIDGTECNPRDSYYDGSHIVNQCFNINGNNGMFVCDSESYSYQNYGVADKNCSTKTFTRTLLAQNGCDSIQGAYYQIQQCGFMFSFIFTQISFILF